MCLDCGSFGVFRLWKLWCVSIMEALVCLDYGRFGVYGCPQGNRLGKISSSNLQDEAPTPLSVVGPLFISPLIFHLSRVLLGAWRFGLFRCVYSSFHNRLDLIRKPAFDWVLF